MLPRDLQFLAPDVLYGLAVLPVLWLFWLTQRLVRNRARRASGIVAGRGTLSNVAGPRRDAGVMLLTTLAAVALVVAAARPQAAVRVPVFESFDMIFAIDRSASMLATDVQPSRLSRACLEVQTFLRSKPDIVERVGLVAFAGTPIVTSHLTKDDEIVAFFLEWMKDDHTPFYGTDIGATLETSLKVAQTEAPQRRTIVVLLSDGEDHGEGVTAAVSDLRRANVPVYVVGIGSDESVAIPAPPGSDVPTLRDDDGQPLRAKFSEATLRRVAEATNGTYRRSVSGADLAMALRQVIEHERKPVRFRDDHRDIAALPLGFAAAFLSGLLALL